MEKAEIVTDAFEAEWHMAHNQSPEPLPAFARAALGLRVPTPQQQHNFAVQGVTQSQCQGKKSFTLWAVSCLKIDTSRSDSVTAPADRKKRCWTTDRNGCVRATSGNFFLRCGDVYPHSQEYGDKRNPS